MRVSSPEFDILLKQKPASEKGKLGVVVSKKTAALAVARNKIKRRVRVIVRMAAPDLQKLGHVRIVVKPLGARQKFSAMKLGLTALLRVVQKRTGTL
ncbi:MAG: ribonuclease P protein component [Patescibacteria group bacterium]